MDYSVLNVETEAQLLLLVMGINSKGWVGKSSSSISENYNDETS